MQAKWVSVMPIADIVLVYRIRIWNAAPTQMTHQTLQVTRRFRIHVQCGSETIVSMPATIQSSRSGQSERYMHVNKGENINQERSDTH